MKKFNTLLLLICASFFANAQLNLTYVSNLSYNNTLNDIWGYVAPDGTEYAIVGVGNGTSVVSLADPENPVEVGFVPGDQSTWRDIKTWGETAYITCDDGDDGITVIDLSDLPNSISSFQFTELPAGTLETCHNIYIDEFGYAYLAGCNPGLPSGNGGGMVILDCFTTPGTPIFVANAPDVYAHDVFTRDNKMYASEINDGVFTIYDVADKTNITALGSRETPFAFTHNAWLSDDGNTLFTTDELANAPVGAYDVSDPTDIKFLDAYAPFETLGDGVIPHNVHVWQNWLIVSYYTDGCIIIDATYPDNLVEVGNFDTYIPASTGFNGVWGAYPYLPSGLVICTDIGNGLYVLEPNYVQACYLHGDVTDASNGAAIPGVQATFLTTPSFATTDAVGEFKSGIATAGAYEIEFYKPGYKKDTLTATMVNGEITTISAQLVPATPFALNLTVVEAGSNTPIPNAPIKAYNDFYDFNLITDATGNLTIPEFYEDVYTFASAKWGFSTAFFSNVVINENNNSVTLELETGYEDIFSFDLGWTISSTAPQGLWERGNPIAVSGGPIDITPGEDVDDIGTECYVTGNSPSLYQGVLVNGSTTLTSPVFDISDYTAPMMSYNYWYLNFNVQTQSFAFDSLDVKLSNGTDTVTVAKYPMLTSFELGWFNSTDIKIDSLISPSDNMTFWVTATSSENGVITEAALDHWQVWDAGTSISTNDLVDESIHLTIYPNPTSSYFQMEYDLEEWNGAADLTVFNTLGQQVDRIQLSAAKGSLSFGADLPTGIYFATIAEKNRQSRVLKLIKE